MVAKIKYFIFSIDFVNESFGVVEKAEIDKLANEYGALLENLETIFERINYPVEEMIKVFRSADEDRLSQISHTVVYGRIKCIKELFFTISGKFQFYDYSVLQDVVETSKCDEAIKVMADYVDKVENILIKNMNLSLSRDQHKPGCHILKIPVSCETVEMSVKDFNLLTRLIAITFNLPPASIDYDYCRRGCIVVVYRISLKVKTYLMNFTIAAHELKPMAALQVKCLIIDNELELKIPLDCDHKVTKYDSISYIVYI